MATSPTIQHPALPAEALTKEQAWELLQSMFGTFHEMYEEAGGVEAVIRERYGDDGEEDSI